MRAREALEKHREDIRRIVHAHKAENPRIFGSVATGTDTDESDLDIFIDPVSGMSLVDMNAMANELESLLRRRVDIVTARSLNSRYRDRILEEAQPV